MEVEFVDGEVDGGVVDDVRASARQDVGDDATPKGFAVAVVAGRVGGVRTGKRGERLFEISRRRLRGDARASNLESGASVDVGDAFAWFEETPTDVDGEAPPSARRDASAPSKTPRLMDGSSTSYGYRPSGSMTSRMIAVISQCMSTSKLAAIPLRLGSASRLYE